MKYQRQNEDLNQPTQVLIEDESKLHPLIAYLFEAYRAQILQNESNLLLGH